MKNQKIRYSILSLLLCASCTTVSTSVIPTNKPTSSPIPSVNISNSATPVPSSVGSITPSVMPTSTETTNVTASPTSITTDISEFTTVNGKIYDEAGNILNDVKVTVKSLDPKVNFTSEINTAGGSYIFRNVPVGVGLEVTAFKDEKWTKRTQIYVAKSNLTGVSDSNVLDFGDTNNLGTPDKTNFYFLSNSPEVVDVIPKNQLLKHDQMSFKLIFSEPVKKDSVEKNLYLRYVRDSFASNVVLGDGTNGTTNTDGPPLLKGTKQVVIDEFVTGRNFTWDSSNFDDYGKEVTFSFNGSNGVLTDNKNQIRYGLTLRKDSTAPRISDREGNLGLIEGEFFMNPNRAKNIIFNVESDRSAPVLDSMVLLKNSVNCLIRLNFSEIMVVEGFLNIDFSNLSFYKFYRNGTLIDISNSSVALNTKKSIEISAPLNTFSVGDKIKVEVDPNLKDPAGNFMSLGVTLGEFDNIREVQYNPNP